MFHLKKGKIYKIIKLKKSKTSKLNHSNYHKFFIGEYYFSNGVHFMIFEPWKIRKFEKVCQFWNHSFIQSKFKMLYWTLNIYITTRVISHIYLCRSLSWFACGIKSSLKKVKKKINNYFWINNFTMQHFSWKYVLKYNFLLTSHIYKTSISEFDNTLLPTVLIQILGSLCIINR